MNVQSISFLIPAYNDATTIQRVIQEAYEVGTRVTHRFEILVIDDGSADDTRKILQVCKKKYKQLKLYTHQKNYGYGYTIRELYKKGSMQWLFSIPGDYQIGAKELLTLLPYSDNFDCILGWRKNRQDAPKRLLQSAFYNACISNLFGLNLHDINSVRLMKKELISSITLNSTSAFVDAEMIIQAKRKGYRIGEAIITHRKREGSVGGGGKWWTILPTILEMIRFRLFTL